MANNCKIIFKIDNQDFPLLSEGGFDYLTLAQNLIDKNKPSDINQSHLF